MFREPFDAIQFSAFVVIWIGLVFFYLRRNPGKQKGFPTCEERDIERTQSAGGDRKSGECIAVETEEKNLKDKKLNIINIATLYVGANYGAGFASGREGWQFSAYSV